MHIRHNDLAREWHWLGRCAFSPAYVTHEPFIESSGEHEQREMATAAGRQHTPHTGTPAPPPATKQPPRQQRTQRTTQQQQPSEAPPTRVTVPQALRADVGIHSFWQKGRATLFDVRVTDTYARSHRHRAPDKVLGAMEKEKKAKYLRRCHELRKDFTPLIYSGNGMCGREAKMAEKHMAKLLSEKWNRPLHMMVPFVRLRMRIALARSQSLLIRGSRDREPS